jgi:ATP-binding cassette subfamily B protein
MSVILQDNVLFAATIRENIACSVAGASLADVEVAARLANADEFIRNLPDGYGTVIGERGLTLSRGQRQRLAIARAALRAAPLLILDEPTTGLDEENEQAVIRALNELAVGRTTFLVTHKLALASAADRIFYVDKGSLTECSTHADLTQLHPSYAPLYHPQLLAGNSPSHNGNAIRRP